MLQKNKAGADDRDISIRVYRTNQAKTAVKTWNVPDAKKFTLILFGKDGEKIEDGYGGVNRPVVQSD